MLKIALTITFGFSLLGMSELSASNSKQGTQEDSQDSTQSSIDILKYLADSPKTSCVKRKGASSQQSDSKLSKIRRTPTPKIVQQKSSSNDSQETTLSTSHDRNSSLLAKRYAEWPYLCQPTASQIEEWCCIDNSQPNQLSEEKDDEIEVSNLDSQKSTYSSFECAQREPSLSSFFLGSNHEVEIDYGLTYLKSVLELFVEKGDLTEEDQENYLKYYNENILTKITYSDFLEVIRSRSSRDGYLSFLDFQEQTVLKFLMEHSPLVDKNIICSSKDCTDCKEAKELILMSLNNAPATCKCPHCAHCIEHKKLRYAVLNSTKTPSNRHVKKTIATSNIFDDVYGAGW